MQIVIDIPEDVYTRLFDNGIQDNEIAVDDVCEMAREIRKGTPLPMDHGRLIDADMLWDLYHDNDYDFYEALDDVQTIIEADKAESEEV